jgi:hypothetical protein
LPTPDEERARLIAQIAGVMKPQAPLDPTSPMFGSLDEAANAAFGRLTPGTVEQAGVLYKTPDGQFAYSIPTSQKQEGFSLRAINSPTQSMAGIFHTHPGNDSLGQVFSPSDIEIAQQLTMPSYVQFQKDGSIRAFVPGRTRTSDMNVSGTHQKIAKGDPLVLPPPKAPGP